MPHISYNLFLFSRVFFFASQLLWHSLQKRTSLRHNAYLLFGDFFYICGAFGGGNCVLRR